MATKKKPAKDPVALADVLQALRDRGSSDVVEALATTLAASTSKAAQTTAKATLKALR